MLLVKRQIHKIFNILGLARLYDGAACLSFYLFLSFFPGLVAVITLVSYFSLKEDVSDLSTLSYIIPDEIKKLIQKVLSDVSSKDAIGVFSIGFLFSMWTATSGVVAVMRLLNKVYKIKEQRGFIKLRLIAFGLSLAILISFISSLGLSSIGSLIIQNFIPFEVILFGSSFFPLALRFLILSFLLLLIFSFFYYWGPNQKKSFKIFTPGSLIGGSVFFIASQLFGLYVKNFGKYDVTYGSLGAVIIFLTWLYLFGFSMLLGAEINASLIQKRLN